MENTYPGLQAKHNMSIGICISIIFVPASYSMQHHIKLQKLLSLTTALQASFRLFIPHVFNVHVVTDMTPSHVTGVELPFRTASCQTTCTAMWWGRQCRH